MKKFFKILAMATVALFAVLSCKKENQEVALTGISLDQTTLNLKPGDEVTLAVKFQPENVTTKPAVSWESSDAAVATVADGKVKAVAAGSATITAKADKFSATCTVNVATVDPVDPYAGWDGAWGVIGDFNGWADDVEMVKGGDGWYTAEVTIEGGTLEFKFRRDKTWGDYEFGIEGETELDKELALTPKKGNLKVPQPGVYKMMLKPTAALAKIVFLQEIVEPEGMIAIDGEFSDWADIPAVSDGSHGAFKFAFDEYYAYFYTWRTKEGRFDALWGDGVGYVYFALDLDDNLDTGEELNGNGKYEYIGYIYCFGGTAGAPEIKITANGDCRPSQYSVANVKVAGTVDENGAYLEYRVPRSQLPDLPESFNVFSWGNKDLTKVKYTYPYQEPEIPDTFDYTPSDEYNSADNLWKKAADANAEKYFHRREGAEGNDIPYLTKNQSTYKLSLENATEGRWSSQFFMHPDGEANFIALEDNKIYKVKMTVQSNKTFNGFVKLTAFDPNSASGEGGALWEAPGYPDNIIMVADQPYVMEAELSGKSAANISFTFDFGGNPAGASVYIKDIILVQTGEIEQHNPIEWDYTASEAYMADNNMWKAVDAANTLEWAYNPGWQPATSAVDVKFTNSTYEFTIPEAFDGEWMCQLWIHPTAELNLDPAKKYNFSLTYYSETASSPLFKLYKQGKDDAWCFTPRPTIAQYEVYNLEEKEFTPCEGPLCLLIDFRKATAGSKVFIKDIVLTEVKPAAPANIKEIIAAIPETATGKNTAVEFDVDLAAPVVVSYMNGQNIYVEDETAAILLYMDNPGLAPGVTIKGKFHVKGYWFNGIPELVSLDFLATPELGQADVPLTKVTIAELLANYDKYLLRKCKISGVTVTDGIADGEGNGDRNGEVAQGDNKIAVYAQLKNQGLLLTAGDYGDLVCIPGMYKENKQVYFWQNDWFIPGTPPEGSGIPDYDPIGGFEW